MPQTAQAVQHIKAAFQRQHLVEKQQVWSAVLQGLIQGSGVMEGLQQPALLGAALHQ